MLVDEILLSIIKSMERQEVQEPVRDDNYVWCADISDEGRHQPLIKFPQPELGGFENLLEINRHILSSQRELV